MKIQQHDGVVVVEERGTPAGLHQAPQETRRERGRAAPRGRSSHRLFSSPKPQVYIGGKGAAPPLGFPTPKGAAIPRSHLGGAAKGRFPSPPRHLGVPSTTWTLPWWKP